MYIKDLLDKLNKLDPIPTGVRPKLSKARGIKACLFDIYGTLLISASGDIDESTITEDNLYTALTGSGFLHMSKKTFHENQSGKKMLDDFKSAIKSSHLAINNHEKIAYPEVDITSIWEDVLRKAWKKKWISEPGNGNLTKMVFIFELLSNPVFPMPRMKEVILEIKKSGRLLGIISNAQFYTPVIMNYFLNGKASRDDARVHHFDPELTVFSYKLGRAKPDGLLFSGIKSVLNRKYGIAPQEVLFVGNDMHKDILPAEEAGFRTVLFAGDKRSLRLREAYPEVKNLVPDYTITELKQLLTILG